MGNMEEKGAVNTLVKKEKSDKIIKRNYYNKTKMSNESLIDMYVCNNGDELRFGKGLLNNIPFFFLRRFSGNDCKGAILLDTDSISGISKAINDKLQETISAKKKLVLDYKKLVGFQLSLCGIHIGKTSRFEFQTKNIMESEVLLELENIKINGIDYPVELKSQLISHSKKNQEVRFDFSTNICIVSKIEMDIVVHTHINESPYEERKTIGVEVDPYTKSLKPRIVFKKTEKKETSKIVGKREDESSFSTLKNQEILFKYSKRRNEDLNFGKGIINNEVFLYFKRISDGIVSGEIILEVDTLDALKKFFKKVLKSENKPVNNKLFDDLEIITAKDVSVKISDIKFENKTKISFTVKNNTNESIVLVLNKISVNGKKYGKSLKSKSIPASNQDYKEVFVIDKVTKKNYKIEMSASVKLNNNKPNPPKSKIEVYVDNNGIASIRNCSSNDSKNNIVIFPIVPDEPINPQPYSPATLIESRYFYVYTNNITCKKLGHNLIRETAVIGLGQFKFGNPFIQQYIIPVCKCNKCRVYYISESLYKGLERNGRFLPKLLSQSEFNKRKFEGTRGSEHIMYKFGYSVKKDGLSSTGRHKLLEQLIEGGIVTQDEAINHIKYLIKRNRFRKDRARAVEKWEKDFEFLTGQHIKIGVKKIISDDIKKCYLDNNYPN